MDKKITKMPRCVIFWNNKDYNKLFEKKPPVDFKTSKKIITSIHEKMINHLLETNRPIQIRKQIGFLEILFYQNDFTRRKIFVDWEKTRKTGKQVKTLNYHSDGKIYHIHLRFSNGLYPSTLTFKALRKHRRTFTKKLTNGSI